MASSSFWTSWIASLSKLANMLGPILLTRPMLTILGPCIISLIFAYPSIYNIYLSPHEIFYSILFESSKCTDSISFIPVSNKLSTEFTFKVYSFDSENENLLSSDYLLQLYDIQYTLFNNVSLLNDEMTIYSPLDYWNNDKTLLINDDNILQTIQLNGWYPNNYKFQPLNNLKLFSGIHKLDGLMRSASSMNIICYYKSNPIIDEVLDSNLSLVKNNYPKLNIFSNTDSEKKSEFFKILVNRASLSEIFLIYIIIPLSLFIYTFFKLKKSNSVNSKLGLLFTFLVQIILSNLASYTVISMFFQERDFMQIPSPLVILIPLFITGENVIRLLSEISKNRNEISFISKINKAIISSFPKSTCYNILCLIMLSIDLIISKSDRSIHFFLFTILCVFFNYFLTYTYFLTTLIMDANRKVELQDLFLCNSKNLIKSVKTSRLSSINMLNNMNNSNLNNNTNSDNINNHNHNNNINNNNNKNKNILSSLKNSILKYKFVILVFSVLLFFNHIILHWTNGVLIPTNSNESLNYFLNKRGFVYELMKASKNSHKLIINMFNPIIFSDNFHNNYQIKIDNIYSFDLLYLFEFVSFLIFVISCAVIILKLTNIDKKVLTSKDLKINTIDESDTNSKPLFQSKELVKGHVLDIVKLCTSSCPFIVSVGIDHKILVWSPLKIPIPLPIQLPISNNFLPITHVVMSESGSLISVFSKSGEIKCWSRLSMCWIWSICPDELVNDVPLESFFRRKQSINIGRRKLISRGTHKAENSSSNNNKSSSATEPSDNETKKSSMKPLKSLKTRTLTTRSERPLKSRINGSNSITPNSLRPKTSLSIDSNFNQSIDISQLSYNSNMEFIIVLKNGTIISINCTDGTFEKSLLSNNLILSAKKLLSPRVNDRIVGIRENGELVVSTCINNKWKSRPVKVDTSNYNMGRSLITPAILSSTYLDINSSPTLANFAFTDDHTNMNTKKVDFNDNLNGIVMETVPFVGMIVRAYGSKCQLIDVQTGTVLKDWRIGKFISNTFKVFHPEPSHCRFCGCASVESFSIAYTESENNYLILHTFSIDNRAKNNICLRVERDARETRCLGFASVNEHRYWLSHVEGWCPTDLNTLMGLRRKFHNNDDDEASKMYGPIEENSDIWREIFEDEEDSYLNKSNNFANSNLRKRNIKKSMYDISIDNKDVITDIQTHSNIKDIDSTTNNKTHKLSYIWEGWTMHADGKVRFYEIPDGSDSGLLIKKLGPIQKFGHKSIIVSFGNIMKVLYLGNDNLIEEENDEAMSTNELTNSRKNPSKSRSRIPRTVSASIKHSHSVIKKQNLDNSSSGVNEEEEINISND